MKERILTGSLELCLRYGIKSVTMDDIAANLSISKKTIYQYFKDKNEIVTITCKMFMDNEEGDINQIKKESKNAIDEMVKICEYIKNNIANLNPSILFDLKKYHPEAWDIYTQHKEKCILETIRKNMEEGIVEGYYHKDIDVKVLSQLRMGEVEMVWDPAVFPPTEYNIPEVQMQVFIHFLRGILTPKGYELWNKLHNNN